MRRQPTAAAAMAVWVGPHWQAMSAGEQPAAEMAVARHPVAQAGCPEKFWAEARPTVVRRMSDFILMVVCLAEAQKCVCGDDNNKKHSQGDQAARNRTKADVQTSQKYAVLRKDHPLPLPAGRNAH